MVESCDCELGCPRCVFDRNCGNGNEPIDRPGRWRCCGPSVVGRARHRRGEVIACRMTAFSPMSLGEDIPRCSTAAGVTAVLGLWQAFEVLSPQELSAKDVADAGVGASEPRTVDLVLGDAAMLYALPGVPRTDGVRDRPSVCGDHDSHGGDTGCRLAWSRWPSSPRSSSPISRPMTSAPASCGRGRRAGTRHLQLRGGALGELDVESFEISSVPWALGGSPRASGTTSTGSISSGPISSVSGWLLGKSIDSRSRGRSPSTTSNGCSTGYWPAWGGRRVRREVSGAQATRRRRAGPAPASPTRSHRPGR